MRQGVAALKSGAFMGQTEDEACWHKSIDEFSVTMWVYLTAKN